MLWSIINVSIQTVGGRRGGLAADRVSRERSGVVVEGGTFFGVLLKSLAI